MVELAIYDINGRLVSTLYSGVLSSGNYTAVWDASSEPSGLYVAQLTSGNTVQTTKLVLLK
jgi:flagellar hook assembly protein FlgD